MHGRRRANTAVVVSWVSSTHYDPTRTDVKHLVQPFYSTRFITQSAYSNAHRLWMKNAEDVMLCRSDGM